MHRRPTQVNPIDGLKEEPENELENPLEDPLQNNPRDWADEDVALENRKPDLGEIENDDSEL